jgi:hypothetical protein
MCGSYAANQSGSFQSCVVCPSKYGAFKSLADGSGYIHVVCALWIPEIDIQDTDRIDKISVTNVPSHRWNAVCCLCSDPVSSRAGACLQCDAGGCKELFHVTCALDWNLLEYMKDEPGLEDNTCFVYCKEHCSQIQPQVCCLNLFLVASAVCD